MPVKRRPTVRTREQEFHLLFFGILGVVLVLYLIGAIKLHDANNPRAVCSDEQTTAFVRSILSQYFTQISGISCVKEEA
jgi:hypothetical protein